MSFHCKFPVLTMQKLDDLRTLDGAGIENEDGAIVVHADLRCGNHMLSTVNDCSCGSGQRPVRGAARAEVSIPSSSESHTV